MVVGGYQALGLLFAICMQLGFLGLASRIKSPHLCYSYLLALIGVASLSAWQGLTDVFKFAPLVVIPFFFYGMRLVFGFMKKARPDRPKSFFYQVPIFLLMIATLYAALPDYRYDQWNYHLLVGKQVARAGAFSQPVIYGPLFFTGIYEFLTTTPRLIWDHDVFCQAASNSFSFLSLIIFFGGFVRDMLRSSEGGSHWSWWFLAAIIFATPDHEVLFSSKPDPLLLCSCAAILGLLLRSKPDFRLLGLLLAATVSLKLTFVHFALAFVVSYIAFYRGRGFKPVAFAQGAGIGFLISLPFLIKNQLLFGNVLHPIQVAFFRSEYWDEHFSEFWRTVAQKAETIPEYFEILVGVPFEFARHSWCLILPFAALPFIKHRNWSDNPTGEFVRFLLVLLAFYFLFWPMFYHKMIYARFVYPGVAVLIVFQLILLPQVIKNQFLWAALLVTPTLLSSSLEVRVNRVLSGVSVSPSEYYSADRLPFKHYEPSMIINAHRKLSYPKAGYREARVVTDTAMGYFLDTERLFIASSDWKRYVKVKTGYDYKTAPVVCLLKVLKEFDVRYLWIQIGQKKYLPDNILKLTELGQQFDDNHRIYHLPEEIFHFADRCTASSDLIR